MLLMGSIAFAWSPIERIHAAVSCNSVDGVIMSETIIFHMTTECFTPISVTVRDVEVQLGGTLRIGSSGTRLNPVTNVIEGGVLEILGPPLLNDTAIIDCGDIDKNDLACSVIGFPNQDVEHGRDLSYPDDADGHVGFNFTKLDASGTPLDHMVGNWSCVRDNITDLVWEVKTIDGGLMDQENSYTWYNSDSNTNGGDAGTKGGGLCTGGIACDTEDYVSAVNQAGLCGANDWRMPTPTELLSIGDLSVPNFTDTGTVDEVFFLNATDEKYWTATPDASNSLNAWIVDFRNGKVLTRPKSTTTPDIYIWLVRGGK